MVWYTVSRSVLVQRHPVPQANYGAVCIRMILSRCHVTTGARVGEDQRTDKRVAWSWQWRSSQTGPEKEYSCTLFSTNDPRKLGGEQTSGGPGACGCVEEVRRVVQGDSCCLFYRCGITWHMIHEWLFTLPRTYNDISFWRKPGLLCAASIVLSLPGCVWKANNGRGVCGKILTVKGLSDQR